MKDELSKDVVSLLSNVVTEMKFALLYWGLPLDFDNSPSKEILGIKYHRTMEMTLNEMAVSMIDNDVIPLKGKPKAKPAGA